MKEFKLLPRMLAGLLLSACVSVAFIRPSDEILTRLLKQLAAYTETYTGEKIYLHLDKPYYFSGDDLWFSAYVVNATTHQPDSASGVMYVELMSEKGNLLYSEKIKLNGGHGHGDFSLGEELPSATYQIRAYTRWMQNGKPDFFFHRQISVINSLDKFPDAAATEEEPTVQFFPEGGDLVDGIESTVAFKTVNKQGRGVSTHLFLLSNGDTIGRFATSVMGMGSFRFTPVAGKTYQALVKTLTGKVTSAGLPKPLPQGWVMHVENTPTAIHVWVKSNKNIEEKLYIVAQTRGKVTFQSEGRLINNQLSIQMPSAQFPSGITQLTAFDANGQPQVERLVFVNHQEHIELQLAADKPTYRPREKVTLTLTARDKQGNPVSGNFSIAVTDSQAFNLPEHSILTNLLLTSDLKGPVENPAFYFQENQPAAQQALDLLMLTQGWRRFTWTEIMQPQHSEPIYEHESDISFTIKLIDKATQKILPSEILLLSAPGTNSVFRYGYTNEAGKIQLNNLHFSDYRNVIVSVYNKELHSSARVVADTLKPAQAAAPFSSALIITNQIQKAIQQHKSWTIIRKNYAYTDINPVLVASADTLRPVQPIYQKADDVIKLADFTLFPTMEEVIREIVPWGIVTHKKGGTGFRMLNPETKLYFKLNPIYLIDNVPVHSIEPVLSLDPTAVYSIESVRSSVGRGQFGEIGYHGIFSVFTKAGDFYPSNEPGLFNFSVRGFQKAREFYSPVYSTHELSRQPDFRRVAYWNPSIQTDLSGKATITFYNSDDVTTWRAQIEGLSSQGKPAVGKLEYLVQMSPAR